MDEEDKKTLKNHTGDLDDFSKHTYSDAEEDDIDQEEYKNQQDINIDTHAIEIINNIRLEMIQYCDDMALPLCDYLTHDAMNNFIEFFTNPIM